MKKYCIYTGLLFFITCGYLFGQVNTEWIKRFNGTSNRFDIVTTMKLDQSGNPVIFGSINNTGTFSDITAIKYSVTGNIIWQTAFNGFSNQLDECKDAIIDNSGNSILTGFTTDTNLVLKIVTLKINSSGVTEWSRVFMPSQYNQGMGLSITADNTGNIYTCGSLRRTNGTNTIVIIKYSPAGVKLSETFYNKTNQSSETPVSICISNTGNIFVLASSDAVNGQNDLLVLKYSPALMLLNERSFSGNSTGNDVPVKMILMKDDKPAFIAAVNNQPGGLDYGIYRLDENLNTVYQYSYNGTGNNQDIPYALTCDSLNNLYVTGSSRNADTLGSEDFYTIKLNSGGQVVWAKRFDASGRGHDYGTSVSVDKYGNVFAGGSTDKHGFHLQYGLLKYRANGDLEWLVEYSRMVNSEDFIYSVIADNNSNIYVTGISFDSLSDYDVATIKYSEPVGIINISNEVPSQLELHQNYPNPFNPETKISFEIPVNTNNGNNLYKLELYDLTGKLIKILFNSVLKPGKYIYDFRSNGLSSGVYLYKISNLNSAVSKKMIIIK
jgi:hypothetical protein